MAQLSTIIDAERSRPDFDAKREIRLYPDGTFFRAYEWSAWLCVRYIRQLKVTRRTLKNVDTDIVFVGFPKNSLDKYILENTEVIQTDEHIILRLSSQIFPPETECEVLTTDFSAWRESVPKAADKKKESKAGIHAAGNGAIQTVQPQTLSGIMQRVLRFDVMNSSPMVCMNFLNTIQQDLKELM